MKQSTDAATERLAEIRANDQLVHRLHGGGWDDHATDAEMDRADLLAIVDAQDKELQQLRELYVHACSGARERESLRAERDEAQRNEREARIMMHLVVKATGGEVTVPQSLYVETVADEKLERTDDAVTGDMTFRIV
jgi:hypothetical protein